MNWIWCDKYGYRMEVSVCDIRCPNNKCKNYFEEENKVLNSTDKFYLEKKVSYK